MNEKIIALLRSNGRMSFEEIAAELSVESSVVAADELREALKRIKRFMNN